jgi:hypothetical protein
MYRFYENGKKCYGRGHEEEMCSGRGQECETSKRKAVLIH